jgi:predicted nucleic-acid-binding protein
MIGLDANVLVRYVTQDDPVQAEQAARLIETRCTA